MSTALSVDAIAAAEPGFYPVTVLSVHTPTPNLVRVVFGGAALTSYVGHDAPDECVTVHFPSYNDGILPPMTLVGGAWGYHDASTRPECRNYTVRSRGLDTLTIDFVLHETGVASSWARSARPGNSVVLSRPRSWYLCPEDTDWQLLVADHTGLPAVARALEHRRRGVRTHVILEVFDEADVQQLPADPDVTVEWRLGTGNGATPSVLPEAVVSFERPDGVGYVWFAGEARSSRSVRSHVRKQWGYTTRQCSVVGYWRERAEEWLASYRRYEAMALAGYRRALRDGKSETQAQDEFEALLERVGL